MPSPCDLPTAAGLGEPGDPGWGKRGEGWESVARGVGGALEHVLSKAARSIDAPMAVWMPKLKTPGRYRVMTWVPYIENGMSDATELRYLIRHAEGETAVTVDQSI